MNLSDIQFSVPKGTNMGRQKYALFISKQKGGKGQNYVVAFNFTSKGNEQLGGLKGKRILAKALGNYLIFVFSDNGWKISSHGQNDNANATARAPMSIKDMAEIYKKFGGFAYDNIHKGKDENGREYFYVTAADRAA